MGRHKKIAETTTGGSTPFAPDGSIAGDTQKKEEEYEPDPTDPKYNDLIEESTAVVQQPLRARAVAESDDLIESQLTQSIEQENTIKSVAKELFARDSIELKTEVSHDEINDITRLDFLAAKFGISNVDTLKRSFLQLRVSKQRKSRGEFVMSLQAERQNANPASGFLSRMFGMGGGGGQSP